MEERSLIRPQRVRSGIQLAGALLLLSSFLFPALLRYPILGGYAERIFGTSVVAYINFPFCIGVMLLLCTGRQYTWREFLAAGLWIAALVPMLLSGSNGSILRDISYLGTIWFPLFALICRFEGKSAKTWLKILLYAFDIFIVILLGIAVCEKITDQAILKHVIAWMQHHGYTANSFEALLSTQPGRFCSVWGHPLTNAVLFNAFFICNDIYYRSLGKNYPKILYLAVAVLGVLLCAGKTAIAVIAVYMVITNWKDKRWFILYCVGGAALYFLGVFDSIIDRFLNTPLTTGRFEALVKYFSGNYYPLRFWSGYGYDKVFGIEEISRLRAGFEFPPLMFSFNFGILFALIMLITVYGLLSWYMLKKKRIVEWIGFSLLFAQIYTYNGVCLRSNEVCYFVYFAFFLINNSIMLAKEPENPPLE